MFVWQRRKTLSLALSLWEREPETLSPTFSYKEGGPETLSYKGGGRQTLSYKGRGRETLSLALSQRERGSARPRCGCCIVMGRGY
jgi:hypothetical protein